MSEVRSRSQLPKGAVGKIERILLLTHTDLDGRLPKSAFEALGAVKGIATNLAEGTFAVGIIGKEVQRAANRLADCGAERILGVSGPEFEHSRYPTDAAAGEAICRKADASLILAPATSRLARVMPGVAHRIGGRIDTHITEVSTADGVLRAERWCYRQRMEVRMHRTHRPWLLTTDPGSMKPMRTRSGSVQVEKVEVPVPEIFTRTRMIGIEDTSDQIDTIRPDASLLFVAGAGWTKRQGDGKARVDTAEKLILGFLEKTHASLGCSKSLVDLESEGQPILSFLTHMNQIGQTGSTPRHAKGLATCCHGEEPHVVGWRFVGERRAINLDANCGWARGKADVLYVADAFEVMVKVNEKLKKELEYPAEEEVFTDAPLEESLASR